MNEMTNPSQVTKHTWLYWMIQEMSVFWEVIISVTVRQEVHVNMCLILDHYKMQLFESGAHCSSLFFCYAHIVPEP